MRAAGALVQNSLELLVDAERELRRVLAYPLAETLASAGAAPVLEDNFLEAGSRIKLPWLMLYNVPSHRVQLRESTRACRPPVIPDQMLCQAQALHARQGSARASMPCEVQLGLRLTCAGGQHHGGQFRGVRASWQGLSQPPPRAPRVRTLAVQR